MSLDNPLGRKEGQHLEFEDARALEDLASIAREVVAMLNSTHGGEIWIGVAEKDEVAVELQAIPDADRQLRRVQDALIDRIEPSPGPDELTLETVPVERRVLILVRTTKDPLRRPYALVQKGTRMYAIRVQGRIRPMTREELRAAFQLEVERKPREEEVRSRILETWDRNNDALMLHAVPIEHQRLDPPLDLREALANPEPRGGRAGGWTYGNAFSRFAPDGDKSWRLDFETPRGRLRTRISADGALEFHAPLQWLSYERERDFHPFALLEGPTSVLRMFGELLRSNPQRVPCPCLVGLALTGVRGWKLRPFSPHAVGFRSGHPGHEHRVFLESDEIVVGPDLVEWEDVVSGDDRVALRLIRGVYRWFGYEDDAIPKEFDQERRRLTIP